MVYEAIISNKLGYLSSESVSKIIDLIARYNLRISISGNINIEDIYNATLLDKKSVNNEPRYALPKSIGDMLTEGGSYGISVNKDVLFEALNTDIGTINK
jgi:3-dehydroquinate synthetase